jgi:ATP-dependent protease ClpP protease subunit
MTADQAKEYGLLDEVIISRDVGRVPTETLVRG